MGLVLGLMQLTDEPLEGRHVLFPAFDLLVLDHAVEALARIDQFFPEGNVLPGNETEFVKVVHRPDFRLLDPLGNLHLLLAREQRHLPHLPEIHPDRVVQDVQLLGLVLDDGLTGLLVAGRLFVTVDFARLNDVDLERTQKDEHAFHLLGLINGLRQGLVQIVEGEVTLLAGQLDELAKLFLFFRGLCQIGDTVVGRIHRPVGDFGGLLLHCHQFGFGRLVPGSGLGIGGGGNLTPAGSKFRGLGSFAFGDFLHAENHSRSTKKTSNINIKN